MSELEGGVGIGRSGRATEALLAELEPALVEVSGGARAVDRDLRVDRRAVADLVLQSEEGLFLALMVDGRGEPCVARALEALACARRPGGMLARHLGLETGTLTTVLLVAVDGWSARVLERLTGLAGAGLRLFVQRRLESARGRTLILEEQGAPGVQLAAAAAAVPVATRPARVAAPDSPFSGLSAETLGLALDLAERIGRIDSAVDSERGAESVAWFVDGAPLCRLVVAAGRLEGHLAGSPIPHRIHSSAAAEVFLDWVLALHLEHLERTEGSESEGLEDYELMPSPPLPLLTPEEIEAFHGPSSAAADGPGGAFS